MLARIFQEKDFAADFCEDARSGLESAFKSPPDAIVCSVVLPDIDGFWVARRIRTEGGTVTRVPIVLVGESRDAQVRIQGLQVGADVVMERPLANEEIVAQVEALLELQKRSRGSDAAESDPAAASAATAAFRGELSSFPLASVLMMLEMERRTGTLEVVSSSGQRALLVLSTGLFASTELDGQAQSPLDALRAVLAWRSGRFAFRTRDVGSLPPARGSVAAVVLEAMRLEDERNAGQ
ncbi:MAG: Response regulator receiver:Transcriptional regulatory protein C-terminal [Labilithrix sp.]|nr:Response regulator receiver:Transcriptional regulatory protein C-terminal [Labilithrix sp.]